MHLILLIFSNDLRIMQPTFRKKKNSYKKTLILTDCLRFIRECLFWFYEKKNSAKKKTKKNVKKFVKKIEIIKLLIDY